MSNSSLATIVMLSPNSSPRTAKIDTITIHHMAAVSSAEACAASFMPASRKASANYCIGNDGSVALSVDESRRAWTSSNAANDNRAITIEVSNSARGGDWPVGEAAMEKLIQLCVDICQRNGIPQLRYTGDTSGNMTLHKWFASTACPGPYLESNMPWIAEEVNHRLGVAGAPETPKAPTPSTKTWRVQIGAYSSATGAERRRKQAADAGFDAYVVQVDDALWRVQVGSFAQRDDAEALRRRMMASGFSGTVTTLGGTPVGSGPSEPSTSDDGEVVEVKVSTLKKGATGSQVEALQALLIGYGFDLGSSGIDGSFGPDTEAAVEKYKQSKGLTGGTTVGATTWAHLLGIITK